MSSFHILFLIILKMFVPDLESRRRIVKPLSEKGIAEESQFPLTNFVVQLVRSKNFEVIEDWLCGGAIIGDVTVLTSAACVTDEKTIYVIAGASYIRSNKNQEKPQWSPETCTNDVVEVVSSKHYVFGQNPRNWAAIDIALAKVATSFKTQSKCEYTPRQIGINWFEKYELPGTDALTFGWGHPHSWREVADRTNYNRERLHFTAVEIEHIDKCAHEYRIKYRYLLPLIKKHMICSTKGGGLGLNGEPVGGEFDPKLDCTQILRNGGSFSPECKEYWEMQRQNFGETTRHEENQAANNRETLPTSTDPATTTSGTTTSATTAAVVPATIPYFNRYVDPDEIVFQEILDELDLRKKLVIHGRQAKPPPPETTTAAAAAETELPTNTTMTTITTKPKPTAAPGICQNDHGGPLVTWVGGRQLLIGLNSVFRLATDRRCFGPYLYTSTYKNAHFIYCSLKNFEKIEGRIGNVSFACDLTPEQSGYVIETKIFKN